MTFFTLVQPTVIGPLKLPVHCLASPRASRPRSSVDTGRGRARRWERHQKGGARDLAPRSPRRRQKTHPTSLPLLGHPAALLGPLQVRVIWRPAAQGGVRRPSPLPSVTRAHRRASRRTAGARDLAPRRPRRRQTTHPASLPLPGHPAALLAPTLAIRQPSRWTMMCATLLESATRLQGDFLHPRTTHGYRPAKAACPLLGVATSFSAPHQCGHRAGSRKKMGTATRLQGDFLNPRTTHGYRPAKAARAINARAPRCVSQPTAGERRMATSLPLQGTLQGTPPRFLAHCRCA